MYLLFFYYYYLFLLTTTTTNVVRYRYQVPNRWVVVSPVLFSSLYLEIR